jgi:hypothetical protein
MSFMQIDAALLILISLCSMILAQEDGSLTWWTRIPVLLVGAFSFAQALWLLGIWIPSAAGYPWPRLTLDTSFAIAAVSRTIVVLVALRRNSGRLFAVRPFGVCRRNP